MKNKIQRAVYRKQKLEEYEGNPYIEALPEIFDHNQIHKEFSEYPIITEMDRNDPIHIKAHKIRRIKDFVQALPIHFRIAEKISVLIRRGYLSRNPVYGEDLGIIRDIKTKREEILSEKNDYSFKRGTAESFAVIGISGIGKTTAVERLLMMYPQVVLHENYHDTALSRTQIVWLKIDCPHDGNLSTLCKAFFKSIDELLGTNYFSKYGVLNRSTSTMMLHMTELANLYGIGVLVIDELQHLINAKIDSEEMLNFFVTLSNTVNIPTILIGTLKAQKLFEKDLRHARRHGSAGSILWSNMKKDSEEWKFFFETLWEYQWIKNPISLDKDMIDFFYDQCQGITSVAVNLFALS